MFVEFNFHFHSIKFRRFRDENCQGCRRYRTSDRENALEIIFGNDITLILAAKTKSEQDQWVHAVMTGLSQGVR